MKKLLIAVSLLCTTLSLFSQTDGISYQAVIIAPYDQELPGVDVTDNILPNAPIAIRFTILDAQEAIEFQEEQFTQTDEFGRINLVIGSANHDAFTQISWDGTKKNLMVEIDFEAGGNYVELSKQELLFVPYAYHRNITATGTLKVDGPTDLFSSLRVHNNTILERNLTVREKGTSRFFGKVRIDSTATFYDNFTVDSAATATFLGPVNFVGPSTFNSLNVNGETQMKGQVTIDFNAGSLGEDTIASYPLLVQGSEQGIAIKVNGNRSIDNNYISFWDDGTGQMWGRIEGITLEEMYDDPEYKLEYGVKVASIAIEGIDAAIALLEWGQGSFDVVAALTSITACAGVGACFTAPIPSFIASNTVNFILKAGHVVSVASKVTKAIVEERSFVIFRDNNIGVSYSSGAGDYAEWLPKQNDIDIFMPGELVGIKHGKVTKDTWGVEKVMIVSTNPIVLGNMPQPKDEENYVKIAFMGQVPVRVLGKVKPGDYIIPNLLVPGFGTAVHPENMSTKDYKKVAGVAWNVIETISDEVSMVNVAVGINTNDLSDIIVRQEEELKSLRLVTEQLENQITRSNAILADLVPGFAEASGLNKSVATGHHVDSYTQAKNEELEAHITPVEEDDIVYFEIPEASIEEAINLARQLYVEMVSNKDHLDLLLAGMGQDRKEIVNNMILIPIEEHPFWQQMDNNPAYREEITQLIKSDIEKSYHTHKAYAHNFTDLKVRK